MGRTLNIEQVARLIDESPLVTLTGPGGIGKTRLAIEVARHLSRRFAGGVVFVELAALRDPELLIPTIGATLGIGPAEATSTFQAVSDRLGSLKTLLVLDNFEQISAAASAVGELLAATPNLRVAVTSRMPLHLAAEQEYPVGPLGLPDRGRTQSVADIGETESVALFVARARAVRPDFALTAANVRALAELCHRLDGLPLALELAAARMKVLSPEVLLDRLQRRLPALAEGPADAQARQRTLRETIAWSWELLPPREQLAFARCAVFVGGFSLAAAEAVVFDRHESADVDLLEIIGHLVDASLLETDDRVAPAPRFAMLETIRDFAEDQWSAPEGEALRDRHLSYFVVVAEAEESQERGVDQVAWLSRVAADRDNFRAALTHSQVRRDAESLLRLGAALERRFWLVSGDLDFRESRRWLETGLALDATAPPGLRAKALLRLAWTVEGSPTRMLFVLEESLLEYERARDEAGIIEALSGLGHVAIHTGDLGLAESALHRALALARAIQIPPQILVELLVSVGLLAHLRRDYVAAAAHLDEALGLARRSRDTWGTAFALDHIGRLALSEGHLEPAKVALSESAELARAIGDAEQRVEAELFLSTAWIASGSLDVARSLIRDVERTARDLPLWYQFMTLEATAEWLAAAGASAAAVTCLAAADRARTGLQEMIETDWEASRQRLLEHLRRDVHRVEFELAWAAGHALSLASALEQGLRTMEAADFTASATSPSSARNPHELSRRELEVLALVAVGRSDGEIAEQLFISKKTASVHVAHIKDKLRAENRVEIVLLGIRLGLVEASPDDAGTVPPG